VYTDNSKLLDSAGRSMLLFVDTEIKPSPHEEYSNLLAEHEEAIDLYVQ
jgi:hypothetical protein